MSAGKALEAGELGRAMEWLCDQQMFANWKQHGNAGWALRPLVTMALLWSWGEQASLDRRFKAGLQVLPQLFADQEWGGTYQGFTKALIRWSAAVVAVLVVRLRCLMQHIAGDHWSIGGWVVMAVDGTRIELAHTAENAAHFSRLPKRARNPKRKQKGTKPKERAAATPQAWLTVMWSVGLGLLWDWRQGPSESSERAHLLEMIDALPDRTLLVADAGFQGYEYWRKLLDSGHSFLIRVGAQVRLLQGLVATRRNDIAWLWPVQARRQGLPPIVVRLIQLHDGKQPLWLATSVVDKHQLSDNQALEIYRRRWGVEVFIRGFKQTYGRGKLRSHAPQQVELELDWSLVGLWTVELLAIRELLACGRQPQDLSTAQALDALRTTLCHAAHGLDHGLFSRLAAIRNDGYTRRQKSIRVWPRKKGRYKPPQGTPHLREATLLEVATMEALTMQAA